MTRPGSCSPCWRRCRGWSGSTSATAPWRGTSRPGLAARRSAAPLSPTTRCSPFALHLRGQELSLRDIAARLVIATGKKKGQHPSPVTALRMLRDHDEKAAAAAVPAGG